MSIDYKQITGTIRQEIERSPYSRGLYEDYLSLMRGWIEEDPAAGHEENRHVFRPIVLSRLNRALDDATASIYDAEMLHETLYQSLVLSAPAWFEDYLQAVEFRRPSEKKFYAPRRVPEADRRGVSGIVGGAVPPADDLPAQESREEPVRDKLRSLALW